MLSVILFESNDPVFWLFLISSMSILQTHPSSPDTSLVSSIRIGSI